jgi:hypothetical protein
MGCKRFTGLVSLGILFAHGLFAAGSLGADAPVIDSIEGDRIVVIKSKSGNRVGTRGTSLQPGDVVKTGARASARILYPDGSLLLVGKSSEVEVQEAGQGTQWNRLKSGEVRGIVKKTPQQASQEGETPRHRFAIRSKSAVMGVRGTDFVFSAEAVAGKAEVRTLEGVVEVAGDESGLVAGQGVQVAGGQFVSATPQGVQAPKAFDVQDYYRKLNSRRPEFVKLAREQVQAKSSAPQESGSQPPPSIEEIQARQKAELEKKAQEALSRRSPVRLALFEVGGLRVQQPRSEASYTTFQLAWTPELELPVLPLMLRAHLAGAPLKSRSSRPSQDEMFYATQAGVRLVLTLLKPLEVDVGPGGEWWLNGHGERGFLAMANVSLRLEGKLIQRVYLGYSHYDKPNPVDNSSSLRNWANEIRAGIGVAF